MGENVFWAMNEGTPVRIPLGVGEGGRRRRSPEPVRPIPVLGRARGLVRKQRTAGPVSCGLSLLDPSTQAAHRHGCHVKHTRRLVGDKVLFPATPVTEKHVHSLSTVPRPSARAEGGRQPPRGGTGGVCVRVSLPCRRLLHESFPDAAMDHTLPLFMRDMPSRLENQKVSLKKMHISSVKSLTRRVSQHAREKP